MRQFYAIALCLLSLVSTTLAQGSPSNSSQASASPSSQAGRGGGANADFDSLIELIQSTVAVESWAENGGGEGDLLPFEVGGVLVDAAGTLQLVRSDTPASTELGLLRQKRPQADSETVASETADPRQPTQLRYVSLSRLERAIASRQSGHQPLDEAMLTLAGLRRVRFVFVYPESGDLVLAGPAADWHIDSQGRIVSVVDDQPIVRLDDLLTLLRRERLSPGSHFGCSITPRQESLQRTQEFLDRWSKRPIQPGQRDQWLAELRQQLGQQDVTVFGVDPSSRVALVLVAADYHMKLIGMGLEEGVVGVKSYLDTLSAADAQKPMSVLRWWFAMRYESVRVNVDNNAFEIAGLGARVLSETELLSKQGKRIHTGQADPLTALFANKFSANFTAISQKYPLYTELRNMFDLALVAALIESESLAQRAGWQPSLFYDPERLRIPAFVVPKQVDTVMNHRIINRRRFVAGISGGVIVAPKEILAKPRRTVEHDELTNSKEHVPQDVAAGQWWWDFAQP